MRIMRVGICIAVLALTAAAGALAQGSSYVLQAAKWDASKTAAVAQAGGTVVFGHGPSGLGVATSSDPNFLSKALASKAFQDVTQDVVVSWQPPTFVQEAITPGDETFINLQWNMQALEAPAAWAAGCTGQGVRVAVIDGGIWNTHVDLAANMDNACSVSFVPGFNFNQDVGTFWHATHVAGIIAAADNSIGVIGVAPKATIIGVKSLHNGSGSFGAVIGGILYAADPAAFGMTACQRADIINMSLGAVFDRKDANGGGFGGGQSLIGALGKAVNFANGHGVLVVSAAGNNAIDFGQAKNLVDTPGDSGGGLAVSATGPVGFALGATNFRRPASYSNYGEGFVSLAGPGGDAVLPGSAICSIPRVPSGSVTSFCWVFDLVLSSSRGSGASTTSYAFAAGTSMATPAVAGVAALIKQRFPWMGPGQLKTFLAQTADDEGKTGHDEFYGAGFVNARRACTQ